MKRFTKFLTALAALALLALPAQAQLTSNFNSTNFRNLLDNGSFNTAQRTTAAVTGVNTTATYLWDRWAAYSNLATTPSVSLTNITSGLPAGFTNGAQVQRASSNTALQPICLIQEIPSSDITPLAGQSVTLSAYLAAGANFSAASSNITMAVATGTGSDQGLSTYLGTQWTTPASTSFLQPITTTFGRYAWTTTIPAGTTEAAALLCYTPVGTAGTSDYFQVTGVQLEQGTAPTPFEWRPLAVEVAKLYRYYWVVNEGSTGSPIIGWCEVQATNNEVCAIPTPFPLRTATVATANITITTGTIKMNAANTIATWASPTASISTADMITITSTTTATAGQITTLIGGTGGSGKVAISADF